MGVCLWSCLCIYICLVFPSVDVHSLSLSPPPSVHSKYLHIFAILEQEWNTELLQGAGLPLDFLPQVVDSGQEAGKLEVSWYGIPAGTPVLASLGECQGKMGGERDGKGK